MPISLASASTSIMAFRSTRKTPKRSKRRQQQMRVVGDFGHFGDVVRKDMEFLKKGLSRGIAWANQTFRIPQVTKTLDDVLWLRNLEDPQAAPPEPRDWPQPSYPGLTGVDLLMADLKTLETYASYFYHLSKIWSKPLPEVYHPQDVADYFNCRLHIVALRLLEVGSCFLSAAIKIQTSRMRRFLRSNSEKDIDGDMSQYEFGMFLKETMLNLGPTFIKVGQSLSTRPDIIGSDISKVLSKIWSVALKYQLSMPPYYTLVLRSLASLEGLAVAADPNFKTFEVAYPCVIEKLLTENSAATRKVLHSVVFNRKKEFQWQRLSLFLRVGATRKGLLRLIEPKSETSLDYLPKRAGVFDAANLVLRLLQSKDGVVLRRLLMTADGVSLIRNFVSKEASFFRQPLCRVIADALYQWMLEALGKGTPVASYHAQVRLASGPDNRELEPSSRLSPSIYDYQSFLRDKQLSHFFKDF